MTPKDDRSAIEGDRKQLRRGVRSTLTDVRVPKDKPCYLKRHFLLCLRQVVGLAEKLAAEDPERFIWASEAFFLKHARQRNGKTYSQRQVRYCLAHLESVGILTATERVRNGVLRTGFIVRHHDSMTTKQGTRCLLLLEPSKLSRVQGQRRHDFVKAKSASASGLIASAFAPTASLSAEPISSAESSVCLSDCPSECLSEPVQDIEKSCDEQNEFTDRSSKTTENSPPEPSNPVSPIKEIPPKENPANRQSLPDQEHYTCSLSALDDLDLKRRPWGDRIGHVFKPLKQVPEIADLSDYEFDTAFLKYYEHTHLLVWACNEAIQQLFDEPFEGRKSRAKVMGRAMELLRKVHQLDAPGGWLPAMKQLRTISPELRSVIHKENNEPVPASEVLSHPFSLIDFMDSDRRLRTLVRREPELEKLFVAVAERMGVPWKYVEGVWYLNAVMTCLRPVPTVIIQIRDKLKRRIVDLKPLGNVGESEDDYCGPYPRVPEPPLTESLGTETGEHESQCQS